MKKQRKHGMVKLVCLISLSLVIIIVGMLMLIQEFQVYGSAVAQNQDSYLLNSVRYIDRNLSMQLDTYQRELEFVVHRQGFMNDADAWRASGCPDSLLDRMKNNLLSEDAFIEAMLAVVDGQIILSTNGRTDYLLPDTLAEESAFTVTTPDGHVYLALAHQRDQVDFLVLVDLSAYYAHMNAALPVATDRLFLMHTSMGYFIHQEDGKIHAHRIDQVTENDLDFQVLRSMLRSDELGQPLTASHFYDEPSPVTHERLAVIPANALSNGQLTIGMSVDFGQITAPLYESVSRVMMLGFLTMIGVMMLCVAAIYSVHASARRNRELEQLRLKNEEMAKLTEQTLNLYHHQRLETIGTLTSSIAHEFGNLLTPIMGYSIMTLEALPPECEDLADNLQEIYNASRSAKTIISRLNDLSRKNTGASYVYLSPDELVRHALTVTQPLRANLNTQIDLQAGNVYLHGNETQLSQMLLNLIINACHAMQDGDVLRLSTIVDGDTLRIRVEDTGKGIPADHLEKIFDPFFTTREAGKGTGLGLSISLQVAREHGGDITVTSKVGKGSTFDVTLPLSEKPAEED